MGFCVPGGLVCVLVVMCVCVGGGGLGQAVGHKKLPQPLAVVWIRSKPKASEQSEASFWHHPKSPLSVALQRKVMPKICCVCEASLGHALSADFLFAGDSCRWRRLPSGAGADLRGLRAGGGGSSKSNPPGLSSHVPGRGWIDTCWAAQAVRQMRPPVTCPIVLHFQVRLLKKLRVKWAGAACQRHPAPRHLTPPHPTPSCPPHATAPSPAQPSAAQPSPAQPSPTPSQPIYPTRPHPTPPTPPHPAQPDPTQPSPSPSQPIYTTPSDPTPAQLARARACA